MNYDALLIGWDAQALQTGVNFHGGNSNYCLAETARTNMINNDSWMITDAGLDCAQYDDFVITIQSDNPGISADTEFTIPTTGGGYDYNVDCNNNGTDEFTAQTGDVTCDFSTLGGAGTYTIRIKDNTGAGTGFPRIFFNFGGDEDKITGINQWGTGQWTSMFSAFAGCNNLNDAGGAATDEPDLSAVTNIRSMFNSATTFNQDIGNWDTATVTNMRAIFANATAFNRDIGNWDTTAVTAMLFMFAGATAFNQDIGGWNVANVTNMQDMFFNTTLSTANYDALLIGWDAQALQTSVNFHGGNSNYCLGETARTNMINNDSWSITDAGLLCDLIFANGFEDASITSFQASEKQFEYDFSKVTEKLDEQPLLIARGLDSTKKTVIQFYLRNDLGQLQIRMDDFDSIQNDWITGQWQSIDNNKITTISW